jgi:L-asparagine oxygenase
MLLRVDLPTAVTDDLRRALLALPVPAQGLGELLARLLQVTGRLPVELLSALLTFRAAVDAPSTLLVTGVPVDADLPPTPTEENGGSVPAGPVSERALLLLAVLLGEPVSYQGEKHGTLVQDVFPIREFEAAPSNDGSAIELGFHTELTFSRAAPEQPLHVACPDFVMLLGLRCPPDRAATTRTVDARAACGCLAPDQLAELRAAQFQLRAPHSFTRDGEPRPWSTPVPLLHGTPEAPFFAFDLACGVRPLSSEAAAALDALRGVCGDPAIQTKVQLGRGDLLVVDNNRCAHSRSPFPARYDGQDRWLRRVYVRRSIWQLPLASAGSARVLV